VVVADPAAAPLVAGVGTLGFDCDTLVTDLDYLAWREAGPSTPAGDPGEVAGPDETALILYTSGTTGAPKGVELTGRNLGCALHDLHASIDLKEGSVCAAPIPFFHIAGLGMLLAANLNGGDLVLEQPADMAGVLSLLIDRKVTHAVLVPTVLQRLLALPECKTADWSALSYVVYGASPIPLPVLRDATEIIGCSFLQSYGLTESTGGFTLLGPARPPQGHDRHRRRERVPGRGRERADRPSRRRRGRRGRRGRRPLGQLGRIPYAVVVLRPGAELSETDLIAWTRDRLAHFECPVGVSFAPSLARTASGKLQKQAIRASLTSIAMP
jgi:acyl-CoA synthetase (AMP-forming)/AMP-acid ligase II